MDQFVRYLFTPRKKWTSVTVEYFTDPDDQHTFSVHWATPFPTNDDTRLFILIPGMFNNHQEKYLEPFVHALKRRGPTCVVNYPLLADQATGTTIPDYSDERYLKYFLEFIRLRHPTIKLYLVGLSMGGTLALKCHNFAHEILAICSPILGNEVWNAIKGLYFGVMKTAFLVGPMRRLALKNPTKWGTKLFDLAMTQDSRQLTAVVEQETQYTIYQMSIESLLHILPPGKATLVHTKDDVIVPYRSDTDPLFTRIRRWTLDKGTHLMFEPTVAEELITRMNW